MPTPLRPSHYTPMLSARQMIYHIFHRHNHLTGSAIGAASLRLNSRNEQMMFFALFRMVLVRFRNILLACCTVRFVFAARFGVWGNGRRRSIVDSGGAREGRRRPRMPHGNIPGVPGGDIGISDWWWLPGDCRCRSGGGCGLE